MKMKAKGDVLEREREWGGGGIVLRIRKSQDRLFMANIPILRSWQEHPCLPPDPHLRSIGWHLWQNASAGHRTGYSKPAQNWQKLLLGHNPWEKWGMKGLDNFKLYLVFPTSEKEYLMQEDLLFILNTAFQSPLNSAQSRSAMGG